MGVEHRKQNLAADAQCYTLCCRAVASRLSSPALDSEVTRACMFLKEREGWYLESGLVKG